MGVCVAGPMRTKRFNPQIGLRSLPTYGDVSEYPASHRKVSIPKSGLGAFRRSARGLGLSVVIRFQSPNRA